MKNILKFMLVILVMPVVVSAQYQLGWKNVYDGGAGNNDKSYISKTDDDGNLYVAGSSNGWNDVVITKIGPDGFNLWQKTIDIGIEDKPIGLHLDTFGNVYIGAIGQPDPFQFKLDFKMVKYSSEGDLIFEKQIDYELQPDWNVTGFADNFLQTSLGSFILAGMEYGTTWQLNINQNGIIESTETDTLVSHLNSGYFEKIRTEINSATNEVMFFYIATHYGDNSYVERVVGSAVLDAAGKVKHNKTLVNLGPDEYYLSVPKCISAVGDGSVYLIANISRQLVFPDIPQYSPRIIKMQASADFVWEAKLESVAGSDYPCSFSDLEFDKGFSLVTTGTRESDMFVAKYSGAGQNIWSVTDTTYTAGLASASDEYGVVVAAQVKNSALDAAVRKYDHNGAIVTEYYINASPLFNTPIMCSELFVNKHHEVLFVGDTYTNQWDFMTMKIYDESTEIDEQLTANKFELLQNYPNPFNPSTNITFSIPEAGLVTLEVYNLLGQKVAELVDGNLSAGTHEVKFDGSEFSSGLYFYKLSSGSLIKIKKMMLIK